VAFLQFSSSSLAITIQNSGKFAIALYKNTVYLRDNLVGLYL
jgi:hypothetical protein